MTQLCVGAIHPINRSDCIKLESESAVWDDGFTDVSPMSHRLLLP